MAGRVVGGQVPTAPSARPSARPGPKPFEQQELFPVRRVTDVSEEAIDEFAQQEEGEGGGFSGTGYPITGAKPLDLTVTPFVRGTDRPEDVPGSIPPGVNTAYAGQLIEQAFGFGGYKYNSLTGRVERDDLKAISMALPGAIGFAAGIGSALSKKNLERIARKADAQEEGFALGMLQGRIVGVSPAPVGSGYVLSGVLPQNLTDQQRRTVAEQLLGISQRSRAEFAKEQEERQRRIDESQATQQETDAGAGLFQPGDTPAQPDPRYTPPPPVTYTTDPGDRDDSAPAGNQYSLDNYGSSYSATDFSFEDARMGRAEGGSVQRTGFVEGSPDNYAKGDTVADTVKTKVRENSFVLNAPTVERLQEAGMLPKGVDNSDKNATIKANKGGLMDVALSKGEYVIEPEEAQRIGYSFLEKINDQGKAEVDRRQAMNQGGFAGTDLSRIPPLSLGLRPPINTGSLPEGFVNPQPSMPDTPLPPASTAAKPSTPLPERTSFEQTSRDLLEVLEDNKTSGYVPEGRSKSGVTIGIGFDIGQHSVTDLERMGLSSDIIAKFTPYVNKTGQAAKNALAKDPLSLTDAEVEDVNTVVLRKKYEGFEKRYPKYANIPDEGKRAVMFSAYYGGGLNRYKTFRKEFDQAQNVKRAIKKGLIDIIPRGAAEYNRARKALDWYNDYELENMSRPIPKPNSSATR